MNIVRQTPSEPLARWVDCFWYSPGSLPSRLEPARAEHSALPTGAMDVVFNLYQDELRVQLPQNSPSQRNSSQSNPSHRGPIGSGPMRGAAIQTDGAIVHGAQSSYFIIPVRAPGPIAGIHFRPSGGALLLGVPANELSEQHVALSDLWGLRAAQLRTQLLECRSPLQIFRTLEQAMTAQLPQLARPLVHPAISFALRNFAAGSAVSRVSPIQAATGYSARRFNTLFQQAVGLSPKRFCRIQRLRAVVEQIARGAPIEWAQVAADNGYFDQSHLNRDFRLFSGVTPARYCPAAPDSALHMEL